MVNAADGQSSPRWPWARAGGMQFHRPAAGHDHGQRQAGRQPLEWNHHDVEWRGHPATKLTPAAGDFIFALKPGSTR